MPRKRIADQEPAVSTDGAGAAPAKAAAKTPKAPAVKKARAPRASATAVTHRHKKTATIETPTPVAAVEESAEVIETVVAVASAAAPVPPSHSEIATRAYLLWEARGCQGGSPDEDWLQAERELWAERQPAN